MMTQPVLRQLVTALPSDWQHHLRRAQFRLLKTADFQKYQQMRRTELSAGYTLKGFDELECIFIRVPKCATRSLAQTLFGNYAGGHMSARMYQLIFSASEFNRYFKFAFVRNPWDRLVSAYHFLQSGGVHAEDQAWAAEHLAPFKTFDAFVDQWVTPENIMRGIHFLPQSEFICDRQGKILVDFIGRYESLEEDFAIVQQRLNVRASLQSENRTNSRQADYQSYYTQKTRAIVAKTYARDIELFGYSF